MSPLKSSPHLFDFPDTHSRFRLEGRDGQLDVEEALPAQHLVRQAVSYPPIHMGHVGGEIEPTGDLVATEVLAFLGPETALDGDVGQRGTVERARTRARRGRAGNQRPAAVDLVAEPLSETITSGLVSPTRWGAKLAWQMRRGAPTNSASLERLQPASARTTSATAKQ